jgi:tetratricopeptide (TPR) repeat protein
MKTSSILLSLILLFLFAAGAQIQPATSAAELQLGVDAYKTNHYEAAIHHFEKAVDLDGADLTARLYLATAYVGQYIPGVNSPKNICLAERAIEQYQHILDADAERTPKINSAKGIAYLYLNMKKFDDAKKYDHLSADLDPNDPEPYYSIGVIDWTECYQPRMTARAQLGLKPGDNLNPTDEKQRKICDELKIRNTPAIEEGIDSLSKSIQLRPDYDDAMAYLNLMYRERADVECDDPAAREQDLKTADDWVDKTMATRKAKAEKANRQPAPTAPNPQ